jgi:hypothetical protein
MSDDTILEEESSNRTFLYAAGGLAAVMLIGIIAIVVFALTGLGGENAEIAAINQTTVYRNSLVTLTVVAMTVEASQPKATDTPLPPTFTAETPEASVEAAPVETETPVPTPTLGPGGGELPPGGLGMLGAVTAAAVLIGVIVVARRLRPVI